MSPSFLRLLWKEWRAARAFVIGLALFALVALYWCWLFAPPGGLFMLGSLAVHPVLATAIPLMALAGIISTSFAMEHECGTSPLLRSLSVSLSKVATAKIAIGLACAAGLHALITMVSLATHSMTLDQVNIPDTVLVGAELLTWGCLCSLLTSRPLTALLTSCLLTTATSSGLYYGCEQFGDFPPPVIDDSLNRFVTGVRWSVVLVLGAACVAVAPAWFDGATGRLFGWFPVKSQGAASQHVTPERVSRSRLAKVGRLAWCQLRSTPWLWVGLLLLAIFAALPDMQSSRGHVRDWMIFVLIFTLVGGIVFSSSAPERRMLSHLPIRPTFHWAASTFLPCLLIVVTLMTYEFMRSLRSYRTSIDWPLFIGSLVAAIAVGQWISRMTKSVLLSISTCLFASIFLTGWVSVVRDWNVPAWMAVFPITICLSAFSIWCAPSWFAMRIDRLQYAKVAFGSVVAISMTLGGFAWFRATELPRPSTTYETVFDELEFTAADLPAATNSTDENLTGIATDKKQNYRRHIRRLLGFGRYFVLPEPLIRPVQDDLLKDRLQIPLIGQTRLHRRIATQLQSSLLGQLRNAIANENPSEAITRLEALLKLSRLFNEAGLAHQQDGSTFPEIAQWAAKASTSPDEIDWAIRECAAVMIDRQASLLSEKNEALQARMSVEPGLMQGTREDWQDEMAFALRLMPWEKTRIQRFMATDWYRGRNEMRAIWTAVENRERPQTTPRESFDPNLFVSPYSLEHKMRRVVPGKLRDQRAMIVQLALIKYQKQHQGTLPESLASIASDLPDDAIIDPRQGKPFIFIRESDVSDWIKKEEESNMETDWLRVYQHAFLWSPPFYVERRESEPGDKPTFFTTPDHQHWYPIESLIALQRRSYPLPQIHVHHTIHHNPHSDNSVFPISDVEADTNP
ncbi:MAG: hypothetical protein AAF989_09110 [Planctomycetota bacterium]